MRTLVTTCTLFALILSGCSKKETIELRMNLKNVSEFKQSTTIETTVTTAGSDRRPIFENKLEYETYSTVEHGSSEGYRIGVSKKISNPEQDLFKFDMKEEFIIIDKYGNRFDETGALIQKGFPVHPIRIGSSWKRRPQFNEQSPLSLEFTYTLDSFDKEKAYISFTVASLDDPSPSNPILLNSGKGDEVIDIATGLKISSTQELEFMQKDGPIVYSKTISKLEQ